MGTTTLYADAPPIDPPAGIGLFMHDTDTDMASIDADGKTQITKQYPLNVGTNWYLYPDVLTLKCTSSGSTLDYGTYNNKKDQLWSDLNTDYKDKWQSNMDPSYHIYIMPQLNIDASCKSLDPLYQPKTAMTIADAINTAPIDGIEIHLDSNNTSQNIINTINLLSIQLNHDKRIAVDSKTTDMDKDPSDLTSLSYWRALNHTLGCDGDPNNKGNCIKGFAIPTIYNDADTKQSPDGSVGDFYQQMSYLVSEGFNTIAGWLNRSGSDTAAGDNYFIQPALPGASSINNAASYLSSDNPQPAINSNQQWGSNYSADVGSQYGWTQTGLSAASSGHYSLINQYYPPKGDNRKQVYACHYLCSGLGTYSVIEQILTQTNADKPDYINLDLWKNISNNLSNFCNINTAFAQNTHDDQGKEQGLPLQKDWMSAIAKHGLQTHLVGAALYQLNYSPIMDGSPTDTAVDQCTNKGCTNLNPYPNTISPTSWTMLTNWLTQQDSNHHGWLSNQALSDDDSNKFASLINDKLSCPAPTPGKESINWPNSQYAIYTPFGINNNGALTGATLDKTASLINPNIGDRLNYNCGIYTGDPAHQRVDGANCNINTTGSKNSITISGNKLDANQAYAIYLSVTATHNGNLIPYTDVPWVKTWTEIPKASESESIFWDTPDTKATIPSTYSGEGFSGTLIEDAILLKPKIGDQIVFQCGVYDKNMQRVSGASCNIEPSNNTLHSITVSKLPSDASSLYVHIATTVSRNGATVPNNEIPWIVLNKITNKSSS